MKHHATAGIPCFGPLPPDGASRVRPGAYAVVLDGSQRVLVIESADGFHLPGGGCDPGETPMETLIREAAEECGHAIQILGSIGRADDYVECEGELRDVLKQGHFFRAQLTHRLVGSEHPGHTIHWLPVEAARTALSNAGHAWAVIRALE